jgi:fatty acid desaturase
MTSVWRDPGGPLGYGGALAYATSAHVAGVALLLRAAGELTPLLALLAVALITHGRVVAAYLVHEASHGSVFKSIAHNTTYGKLCLLVAGSPYAHFGWVRKIHLAHHYDRADTCAFDYRNLLRKWTLVRWVVLALEFCFIPAVEVIMHLNTSLDWAKSSLSLGRRATAAAGSAAVVAFTYGLARLGGPVALGLYALATCLFLHVLAAHDAYQHTYEVLETGPSYVPGPGPRTAEYEEKNTFSDLISTRMPILNALVLNFGYHNTHHHKPMAPWWKLPALHAEIYGGRKGPELEARTDRILTFRFLAISWVKHRVTRVLGSKDSWDSIHGQKGSARALAFVGDLGVSFITM